MVDSILISVPVSSPLHPQASLPYLQGFLKQKGYNIKIYDTNIRFFKWFLSDNQLFSKNDEYINNPVKLLAYYSELEAAIYEKCSLYRNLIISLRSIDLDYSRIEFESVLQSLEDKSANPFIAFYEGFIKEQIEKESPKIIGIGITFQDQVIAAFTLANLIRKKLPQVKIVLGGQIITRCHDTMLKNTVLNHLWDYLVCWDGELPLLDIHERIIHNIDNKMINVVEKGDTNSVIDRSKHSYNLNLIDTPDFSDIDFNEYYFSDMMIPLQSARGCYGSCEFCAIPYGSNSSYREREVEKIINDILNVQKYTLKKYGKKATYFKFMDDTSAPKTLLNLAKEIEARSIDAQWETFVRLEKFFEDIDVMKQLYRGGCRKLMWGLESNDPDILKDMNKKISPVSTDKVLNAASEAGILNFVFVLVGFPGETDEQRDRLAQYIIKNKDIHVLTIATFDVTKGSKMQRNLGDMSNLTLEFEEPKGFEVRLPYTVNGKNWKKFIVTEAQKILYKIIKERPDIGFMSLMPDQARGILCDKFGNRWGEKFLSEFGEDNIRQLLLSTENYIDKFSNCEEIDLSVLPEPLKREHSRTMEDISVIAKAISSRRKYEGKRIEQV